MLKSPGGLATTQISGVPPPEFLILQIWVMLLLPVWDCTSEWNGQSNHVMEGLGKKFRESELSNEGLGNDRRSRNGTLPLFSIF